jgi:aminoglycoside phosphotransferase (APT) family kinase protein
MTDPLTREYSERLGVLRAEQLQAALDRFDLGRLIAAEPARQGLFGQIVMIESSRGDWVLRGAPHEEQLPRERFVARLIHERTTLTAPWPYHIETSAEIFGWPFALMHRIPGVVEGADEPDGRLDLARALGEGLAALHAIEGVAPGYYDPAADAVVPYPVDHETRVVDRVHEWLGRCREARPEATDDADVAWLEEIVAENRSALRVPFMPCFVHHDYKPNNVLCEHAASGWSVRGVVDLAEGYFGDPEEDLVRCVATFAPIQLGCVRPFVAAYARCRPLRPGHQERYRIYQLMDRLVMWEYGQRNGLWFRPEQRFRSMAEHFVSVVQPFPG